ncbi:MAG: plastocyanin/azurin family copper-binding protein [Halobacteriaceae archaeon]
MIGGTGPTRRAVLGTAATALVSVAGCVSGGSAAPDPKDDYDVGMSAIAFAPDELTVPVGTTVVWKNTNSRTHTVTAYEDLIPAEADYFASGGFDSQSAAVNGYYNQLAGGIGSQETYRHTFSVPGDYRYFCVPHEQAGMTGTITVTDD